MKNFNWQEESLDPENWDAVQQLGHQMIDDIIDFLKNIESQKVWSPVPKESRDKFQGSLPAYPASVNQVYNDFKEQIMPYRYGNIHPRFWGWVNGTGSVMGVFADMLSSALNSNCSFGDQSAIYMELQVLNWLKEMFSLPVSWSGILVSGGSIANLYGLAAARNNLREGIVRTAGNTSIAGELILYCSTETHNSIDKAIDILGIGKLNIRKIPVMDDYTINVEALSDAISKDKGNGLNPFCVVANAGTVNTGATDPLDKIAGICKQFNLWFHIDGAFGMLAALSSAKSALRGYHEADSIAFDLHKWLYMNHGIGCVLFKSVEAHQKTFSAEASYLIKHNRGITAGPVQFNMLGFELSRPDRALKAWMLFKEHGIEKYKRLIEQNILQATYLAHLIQQEPYLELMSPVPLNIVCFRYKSPNNYSTGKLNFINKEIVMDIQESGIAVVSYTILKNQYVIRVAITNHRSRRKDFEILVAAIVTTGKKVEENIMHANNFIT